MLQRSIRRKHSSWTRVWRYNGSGHGQSGTSMTSTLNVVGGVLLLVGVLWALQGIGLVGGSFMTGQRPWLFIGMVTAGLGLVVLLWTNLRER